MYQIAMTQDATGPEKDAFIACTELLSVSTSDVPLSMDSLGFSASTENCDALLTISLSRRVGAFGQFADPIRSLRDGTSPAPSSVGDLLDHTCGQYK